jgi:hypothetical protein
MSYEEPTATVKITFDDLSPDLKSFAFVLYILLLTVLLYIQIQLSDIFISKVYMLYKLYKTRNYQSLNN